MRKILILSALIGISFSILLTGFWISKITKRKNENYEAIHKKFNQNGKEIADILERLSVSQEAFSKTAPITTDRLSELLYSVDELRCVTYYDRYGNVVQTLHQTGESTYVVNDTPDVYATIHIHNQRFGWADAVFQTDRTNISFLYLTPVYDSFSKTPIGYIAGEYHVPVIVHLISELFRTNRTFAYILNEAEKTVLHPYYQPNILPDRPTAPSYFLSTPLPNTAKWTLVMQMNRIELYQIIQEDLKYPVFIAFSWGISLILLLAFAVKANTGREKPLWFVSFAVDGLFLGVITLLFYCFINLSSIKNEVINFLDIFQMMDKKVAQNVIKVPTTVQIAALSFPDSQSFTADGFVAQVYPANSPVKKGFVFPNQSGGDSSRIEEISRYTQNGFEYITWHFNVLLREPFNQELFPFDKRQLDIILWPIETTSQLIFVPDPNEYRLLFPSDLPGISSFTKILGWQITSSSFLVGDHAPFSFLFLEGTLHNTNALVYSVETHRNLVYAFTSNFFPLFICMIFAFAVLMIPTKKIDSPTLPLLSILIAIIFVVVLNQQDVRKSIGIGSFAYIEYLYISIYLLITLMSADFVIWNTAYHKQIFLLSYRDHLLPKLLYWPIIFGIFLSILLFSFFQK